jgi:protein required for attachment to host cells
MTQKPQVQIVKPPVTWILVADGRKAQVYTRSKVEKIKPLSGSPKRSQYEEALEYELVPLPEMAWQAEPEDTYQTGRKITATVFESVGSARHMSEPNIDAREEIKINFAKKLASQLNHAEAEKNFNRLIIAAPAKMLSEIKSHLDKKLLKLLAAEIPKDLTRYDGQALAEHLEL